MIYEISFVFKIMRMLASNTSPITAVTMTATTRLEPPLHLSTMWGVTGAVSSQAHLALGAVPPTVSALQLSTPGFLPKSLTSAHIFPLCIPGFCYALISKQFNNPSKIIWTNWNIRLCVLFYGITDTQACLRGIADWIPGQP